MALERWPNIEREKSIYFQRQEVESGSNQAAP